MPPYKHNQEGVTFFIWSFFPCNLWIPGGSVGKESVSNAGDLGSISLWIRKIPWGREWQHIPVFLSGEFDRQRSLAGYSAWGSKELDTIEWLTHTHRCNLT